ncbi:MAG: DUF465 domain-containing protein [Desulfovibrio sp.]|nr:DUF465 domain-containing protein [Desulfovibrio sp.]
MDQHELELLEKYAPEDPELKSLWDDHLLYEKQIEKLESKKILTPAEQQTLKQLKKQKLEGKTRLMDILDSLKKRN